VVGYAEDLLMAVKATPTFGTVGGGSIGARALASCNKVVLQDDVWSAALSGIRERSAAIGGDERVDLEDLAAEMERSIMDLRAPLQDLRTLLNAADDEVESEIRWIAGQWERTEAAYAQMFGRDISEVAPRGASILGCDFLLETMDAEVGVLNTKRTILQAGGVPDPDLRKSFRCALYLAGVSSAAAIVAISHGTALALGAINGGAGAILGWESSSCAECWREITKDRF
jgi:hypothetical protein